MEVRYLIPGAFTLLWLAVSSFAIISAWKDQIGKCVLISLLNLVLVIVTLYMSNRCAALNTEVYTWAVQEFALEYNLGIPAGSQYYCDLVDERDKVRVEFYILAVVNIAFVMFAGIREK